MKMFDPIGVPVFLAGTGHSLSGGSGGDQGGQIDHGGYTQTSYTFTDEDGNSYIVFVDSDGGYWVNVDDEWISLGDWEP